MTPKQKFENLIKGLNLEDPPLYRPILMHFAARYSKRTYAKFASDHKILVDCNLKCRISIPIW